MEQVQIDLIEVGDWAYVNDKTEYLMTIKDMFSKFARYVLNAKKMIKKNLKSQKTVLPPLKFSDKVRVDMKSTHEVRSMSDITKISLKKKREYFNFTKEVSTVIEVKEDVEEEDLSVTKYRIDFESDRTFFREELLRVKVDELI
jgi:hypothetical protein